MNAKHHIAETLWNFFDQEKWDDAKNLLHENFVAYWPQSREKIVGADNFIELNRNYPGEHTITVQNVNVFSGNEGNIEKVVTNVFICSQMPDGNDITLYAVSFFDIKDNKIIRAEEYWADTYDAPQWRTQYVEKY